MPGLTNYHGLQVLATQPPDWADAGLAYHNNFKSLAARRGDNYFAPRDPSVNDDSSGGSVGVFFAAFSIWTNTATRDSWMCIDPTINNAVWVKLGA